MTTPTEEPKLLGVAQSMVRARFLDKGKALQAQAQAQANKQSFVQYLVANHITDSRSVAQFLSSNFGLALLDLDAISDENIPFTLLNETLIRKHMLIPLFKRGNQLFLAVEDPSKDAALKEIQFYTRLQLNLVMVESDKLRHKIESFLKQFEGPLGFHTVSEESDLARLDIVSEGTGTDNADKGVLGSQDTPIVRFVSKILTAAMNKNASDIHFEPYETFYRVRYRIDGVLLEVANPPISLATRITARIKILSNLDISERRIPQDGRFHVKTPDKHIMECRVSTCPTTHGEKVVIRLLNPGTINFNVNELGLNDQQKATFLKIIQRPHGMIIVSGPTGSGKSLTLYNALNILNTKNVNICTVEDPVEMRLTGINQVNINPKAGLTFSTTLRAFLRQDPDIIMVGEIRDVETAEIAISAAQTGHLVLSTLHTNSAAETIIRLKNMGIPSYNIAGSITLMMSQRLVRRLCPECRLPRHDVTPSTLIELGYTKAEADSFQLYKPVGCYACTNGYKGRIGIYELLPMDKEVEQLVVSGASSVEISRYFADHHLQTIYQSGLEKVKEGVTTIEELNRVSVES